MKTNPQAIRVKRVKHLAAAFIGLTARTLFFFRRTPRLSDDFIERTGTILLIRPEGMGDLIQTLPAIAYLRSIHSNAKIAILVRPLFAQLARDLGVFNEVISFEYPKRSTFNIAQLRRTLKDFFHLRYRFDLAYDFRGDPRNAIIGAWSARAVIGITCKSTSFLLSVAEPKNIKLPATMQNLTIVSAGQRLRPSSVEPYETIFNYQLPEAAVRKAEALTAHLPGYVVVHPMASRPSNSCSAKKWIVLVKLIATGGHPVVLTGAGSRDTAVIEEIIRGAGLQGRVVSLANQTNPTELAAVIERASGLVSPDTGVSHIAYARRIPSVTIFGAANWERTGYSTPLNQPVHYDPPCKPCNAFYCPRTDFPMECIETIQEQDVYDTLMRVMAAKQV